MLSYTKNELIDYILHLADNSLILGHRNSEWTGHGPILEQDIALSNIALDLIGQARNFYQYAASLINEQTEVKQNLVTEDSLAYLRNAANFKNLLLLELSNGDWGKTIMRQFLFSSFQFYLYQLLVQISISPIAAIAEKSVKEVSYHLRWSSEWVIRLGDGTIESKGRMQNALQELFPFIAEMFSPAGYEQAVFNEEGISMAQIKRSWENKIQDVITEAGLILPRSVTMQEGGKNGRHTPALEELLAEMQFLQRNHPGVTW